MTMNRWEEFAFDFGWNFGRAFGGGAICLIVAGIQFHGWPFWFVYVTAAVLVIESIVDLGLSIYGMIP